MEKEKGKEEKMMSLPIPPSSPFSLSLSLSLSLWRIRDARREGEEEEVGERGENKMRTNCVQKSCQKSCNGQKAREARLT